MSDFPSTPGAYAAMAPESDIPSQVSDQKDKLMKAPFNPQQDTPVPQSPVTPQDFNMPPLQAGVVNTPANVPGAGATPTAQPTQAQYLATTPAPPPAVPLAASQQLANEAANLNNAQTQLANAPTVAPFTPYQAAPYPTPQFAPIPTRQPNPPVPTGPALLAAIAGLVAPRYAGEFGAAPLQATQAFAEQQNRDAWQQYGAREQQADELSRNAVAAYNNQQGVDLQNRAGQAQQQVQVYQAALVKAKLMGDVVGEQAAMNVLQPATAAFQDAQAQLQQWEQGRQAAEAQDRQNQIQQGVQQWNQDFNQRAHQFDATQKQQRDIFGRGQAGENSRLTYTQQQENARQAAMLRSEEGRAAATNHIATMKLMADQSGAKPIDAVMIDAAIRKDPGYQGITDAYKSLDDVNKQIIAVMGSTSHNVANDPGLRRLQVVRQDLLDRIKAQHTALWNAAAHNLKRDDLRLPDGSPGLTPPAPTGNGLLPGMAPVGTPGGAPRIREYDPQTDTLR